MLFPVVGSSFKNCKEIVLQVASNNLELGFLLAVFEFEWIIRRLILSKSKCPTLVVRTYMEACCSSLKHYGKAWNKFAMYNDGMSLRGVLGLPQKWDESDLEDFFKKRHVLVHGSKGGIGAHTALLGVDCMFKVLDKIEKYAKDRDLDLFAKLNPRQKRCRYVTRKGCAPLDINESSCPGIKSFVCPLARVTLENRKRLKDQIGTVQNIRKTKGTGKTDVVAVVRQASEVAKRLGIEDSPAVCQMIFSLKNRASE